MKRSRLLLLAVGMYAVAWFVLVIKGGNTLGHGGLPGWQAFRVSLTPIWPYGDFTRGPDTLLMKVLYVASGLSNFVFVFAALAGVLRGALSRALWLALFVCAVINTHWFVLGDGRGDLRQGYYLWAISYFVLAAALRKASAE